MTDGLKRRKALKIKGRVAGLYRTQGAGFETSPVETLELTFAGIQGDRHGGATRRTGGREPWYPRGTEIRNERQLSLLAPNELRAVAADLEIDEVPVEAIGGNLLVEGIERLSWLPARTLLFFEGGVTLKVDGDNAPCRLAGRALAARFPGRETIESDFVRSARHRRGLVVWVEKPGRIEQGEGLVAHVPEQWIYG